MNARRPSYSAAYVLIGLWLALTAAHLWLAYRHSLHDATTHLEPWDAGQFWVEWGKDYVENLQSEAWQIAVAAWVFKHFLWSGAPESKDTAGG